jgi:threonine dehydratase
MEIPDLSLVRAAAARIAPHAHRTPVLRSAFFDELIGGHLLFKCENFQKVGAFKFRGALNAVLSLTDAQAAPGVLTHSSGNHAQALALAAQIRGIAAAIVMPRTSLPVKLAAVEGYGGRVVRCEPTQLAREETARKLLEQTGATFIHPYDDHRIIAGQGTAALELLEQAGEPLDLVLAPVGGGGLMSGTLISCASLAPTTEVIGVEPDGADDARRSLEAGRVLPSVDPRTIADGLLTSLSERTFAIIRQHIHAIVTASDEATIRAMRLVYERMKIVIEPSAAVPLAALLEGKVQLRGRRAGLILSGGNADLDALPWLPR